MTVSGWWINNSCRTLNHDSIRMVDKIFMASVSHKTAQLDIHTLYSRAKHWCMVGPTDKERVQDFISFTFNRKKQNLYYNHILLLKIIKSYCKMCRTSLSCTYFFYGKKLINFSNMHVRA